MGLKLRSGFLHVAANVGEVRLSGDLGDHRAPLLQPEPVIFPIGKGASGVARKVACIVRSAAVHRSAARIVSVAIANDEHRSTPGAADH